MHFNFIFPYRRSFGSQGSPIDGSGSLPSKFREYLCDLLFIICFIIYLFGNDNTFVMISHQLQLLPQKWIEKFPQSDSFQVLAVIKVIIESFNLLFRFSPKMCLAKLLF